MKNIVAIDHYEADDQVVVFISGHSLHKSACTISIASSIAKEIGQESIVVTTYHKDRLPVRSLIQV